VLLGLVADLGQALAQGQSLYLDYEAPVATCPDRVAFWNAFWVRSSKQGEQPTATLRVRITEEPEAFVGRVSIVDSVGGVVERVVSAPTCAEVSLALALISSIALHDLPMAMPPPKPSAAPVPAPVPERAPHAIQWSLGATLGIHTAVAPGVTPTLGIAASASSAHAWGSPEARIELLMTSGRTDSVGEGAAPMGEAQFNWYGGRLSGCPVQLNIATTTFGPCVLAEVGALRGKGLSSVGQVTRTGWWLAPGALLNWVWRPSPLQVRLAAGLVRPLAQDSFKFSPGPTVFRPPNLGGLAQLEVGLSF
jgi:hypothetical protein